MGYSPGRHFLFSCARVLSRGAWCGLTRGLVPVLRGAGAHVGSAGGTVGSPGHVAGGSAVGPPFPAHVEAEQPPHSGETGGQEVPWSEGLRTEPSVSGSF